jgi:hypothetical protein
MKIFIGLTALAVALLVGGLVWSSALQADDPDIIASRGMHAHPTLEIFVKGEQVEIPENIGLGAVHKPVHTHDDLPVIHLEFSSVVRRSDVRLGAFLENWGRDVDSFGTLVRMTVNEEESTEYENYLMRDGDKIQLFYD